MTVKQRLQIAADQLKKNKIKNPAFPPEADREAEILLSHILKKPREFLFTYPEKELTKNQVANYKKLVDRRLKGEPIAYLVGYKEFYGLSFFVNKNVLIPRPETELMVEEAIKHVTCLRRRAHNKKAYTIIDVGTGSGCIIISIAKELSPKSKELNSFLGIDVSKPALDVARRNARLYKINKEIKFLKGNLLNSIIYNPKFLIFDSSFLILANLPYLTPSQINSSLTIKYEPKTALDGGRDGLKYYKKLFRQVKQLIKLNPVPGSLFCEINPKQTQKIKKLAQSELPKGEIKIIKDLAGKDRIMSYACPYSMLPDINQRPALYSR